MKFSAVIEKLDPEVVVGVQDPSGRNGADIVIRLPKGSELPTKGMSFARGTVNGKPMETAIEPDGADSHWFKVPSSLLKSAGAKPGDTVQVDIEPTKEWPEPQVPKDFQAALDADPEAAAIFAGVTPAARWDWIRWLGACKTQQTRDKHIVVALSKMKSGKRRPCCFDRQMCTLTDA
jgi:hypothetical protein